MPVDKTKKPITARAAALTALREFRQGRDLRTAINAAIATLSDARERALATQIALGVVRNTALCDYYIASASNVPMRKVEPRALDILRAAVYQIAFLDKIPPSAAVSEAVNAARQRLNPRAVGFINAVLRKLTSETLPEITAATEAERLAIKYSHPLWLVREIAARIGEAETEQLLAANNAEPPVYARVNTLKTTAAQLQNEFSERGIDVALSSLGDTLELRGARDITRIGAFRRGEFYVQDPSSTLAALALGAMPGETIIDACAAPGGKSFAAAIAMQNRGKIIAFDNERRVGLISDGAQRLGITIITAMSGDSSVQEASLINSADRVLVDAPCSGFGVIRKKPEIRYKSEQEIAALPETQLGILSTCATYVKRGGTLVYSTCTVLKRENEDVVDAFLRENDEFAVQSQQTMWTHRDGGDGFFITVMTRK